MSKRTETWFAAIIISITVVTWAIVAVGAYYVFFRLGAGA